MTGWPWPLESVQGFFEGMWRGIVDSISAGASWLWSQVWNGLVWLSERVREGAAWIWERLGEFGNWLWENVSSGLKWLWDRLQEIGSAILAAIAGGLPFITNAITDFINAILNPVQQGFSWLLEQLQGGYMLLSEQLTQGFTWVYEQISMQVTNFWNQLNFAIAFLGDVLLRSTADLTTTLTSGMMSLGEQISTGIAQFSTQLQDNVAFIAEHIGQGVGWLYNEITKYADGVMTGIAQALGALPSGFQEILLRIIETLQTLWQQVAQTVMSSVMSGQVQAWQPVTTQLAAPAGSISPTLSLSTSQAHELAGHAIWAAVFAATTIGEAATLGQLDISLSGVWQEPYIQAMMATTREIIALPTEIGIITPYRYQLNYQYTPSLPSASDMIRFMVKEAYLPEKQVELPAEFLEFMKYLGYKEDWTRLYWGAHWELPSITQVFTMLHRRLLTPEQVDSYLKLADIEPAWRPLLRAISYDLPDRIRARWMFEWGLIDLDTWKLLDELTGLDPAWSGLVVQAELRNILRDDISAIRSQLDKAVREGLLSIDDYRSSLKSLGLSDQVIDARVAAVTLSRELEAKTELVASIRKAFVEGKLDDQEYTASLARLGVTPDAMSVMVSIDTMKKAPKPIPAMTREKMLQDLLDRKTKVMLSLKIAQEDYDALASQMQQELEVINAEQAKRIADIDDKIRILQARFQFVKTDKEAALLTVQLENLLNERLELQNLFSERYQAANSRWLSRLQQQKQRIRQLEIELALTEQRIARLDSSSNVAA